MSTWQSKQATARKVRDPEARNRIVDAARQCIASLGIDGATVRAIAAEAGVSTGYVMHYFPDKGELAAAVLADNNRRAARRVQSATVRRRGLAALTAAVEALLPLDAERKIDWQVWVGFWTTAGDDGGGADGLRDAQQALSEMLAGPFAEAIDDGDLPRSLDVSYECDRLTVLAAGLGLMAGAGAGAAATVRKLARRMLDDHLASLA